MAELKRVDVGFKGGQVLAVRVTEEEHRRLREALAGGGGAGWHDLRTQDSAIAVDLAEVVYVRLDTEPHRVGF